MPALPWRPTRPIDPTATYVVTTTKLPLRSHRHTPRTMLATWRIIRALRREDGLVGYALKADLVHKTYWTVSAWNDHDDLAGFVSSTAHCDAMAALGPRLVDARIETVDLIGHELPPSWRTLAHQLSAIGTARVEHAS